MAGVPADHKAAGRQQLNAMKFILWITIAGVIIGYALSAGAILAAVTAAHAPNLFKRALGNTKRSLRKPVSAGLRGRSLVHLLK